MVRWAAYLVEVAMLGVAVKKHEPSHHHNRAVSSCSVAVIAAPMGSCTIHGPIELYEPKLWRIDEKVRRALFVNCIGRLYSSQIVLFALLDWWGKLRVIQCFVDPDALEIDLRSPRGSLSSANSASRGMSRWLATVVSSAIAGRRVGIRL